MREMTPRAYPPPPHGKLSTGPLPILQKIVDAYKLWHGTLQHFPRASRYTLGAKIDALFLGVIEGIVLARYAARDKKIGVVAHASSALDLLKVFLQIAWELKHLDTKKYAVVSAPLTEVGRMLGGWQRQLQNEAPAA